jgi:hypothetical protein
MEFVHNHHLQQPLPGTPDVTMSMYDTSNSASPSMSPNMFDTAANTPLPPSPIPSGMMGSPILSDNGDSNIQQGNNFNHLRYGNMNTLGLGLST